MTTFAGTTPRRRPQTGGHVLAALPAEDLAALRELGQRRGEAVRSLLRAAVREYLARERARVPGHHESGACGGAARCPECRAAGRIAVRAELDEPLRVVDPLALARALRP